MLDCAVVPRITLFDSIDLRHTIGHFTLEPVAAVQKVTPTASLGTGPPSLQRQVRDAKQETLL